MDGVPSSRSISGTAACCLKIRKTKVFFSKNYQRLQNTAEMI
jgi:hypothetical protein